MAKTLSSSHQQGLPVGDDVCLICLQMYDGETTKGDIGIRTLEHHQNVFDKVSKYLSSEIFKGCFQWNFVEERSSPVCRPCYSSVEKIFKINAMVEKLQKTIQELVNSFTSEVLGHHNKLNDLWTSENLMTKNANNLSGQKIIETVYEPDPDIVIKEEADYIEEVESQQPTISTNLLQSCGDADDFEIDDFDPLDDAENFENVESDPLHDTVDQEEDALTNNTVAPTHSKNDSSNDVQKTEIATRYPSISVHLKSLKIVLTRLKLDAEGKISISKNLENTSRPRRKAALVAISSLKNINNDSTGVKSNSKVNTVSANDKDWKNNSDNDSKCSDGSDSETEKGLEESIRKSKKNNYTSGRPSIFKVAKRFKCQSQSCNFSFNLIKELKSHSSKSGHSNDKIFKCNKKNCTAGFYGKYDLKNHIDVHHKKSCGVKCKTCRKTFRLKTALRNHQRRLHAEKLFKCDRCEKTFFRKLNLTAHQKLHTGRYYKCKSCSEKFTWKISLKMHEKTNHNEENCKYNCTLCSRVFSKSLQFTRHRLTHFRSKITKIYPCAGCKKIHFVENVYDNCINKYFRGKKQQGFTCAICTSVFRYSKELDNHVAISKHRNKKLFECETCEKSFYKTKDRRKHQEIHRMDDIHKFILTIKGNIQKNKKLDCQFCSKNFEDKSLLAMHIEKHFDVNCPDKFKCDVCGKFYKSISSIRDHGRMHSDVKNYKCKECNEEFHRRHNLKAHLKYYCVKTKDVSETKSFECKFCDSVFENEGKYRIHRKTHGKEIEIPCKYCGKIFKKKYMSKHIMKVHSTQDFKCSKCELSFNTKDKLQRHEITIHTEEKPFSCTLCQMKFKWKYSLRKHLATHSGSHVLCDICGKKVASKEQLRLHKLLHSGNLLKCTYEGCEKKFPQPTDLKKHVKIVHTKEIQYTCEVCHKNFPAKANLQFHLRSHTGERPYPCQSCDRRFSTKKHLTRHTQTVHQEKNIKCKDCGKSFSGQQNLNLHVRTIHGEKKFKCEFCPYLCRRKDYLVTHIRENHTDERAFVCEVCGKGFKRKHVLDLHMKKCHE